MQEEEKNNGMEGMSVEEMFLGVQESYQEAQLRAQEENRAFARTEFFRMDKLPSPYPAHRSQSGRLADTSGL